MPKRSLAEQLNQAIDALLARPDAGLFKGEPSLQPLLRIASQLRDLPREEFKERLKSELRGESMATMVESRPMLRQTATIRLRVRNAAAAIEFYRKAFGATEVMRFAVGDKIPHAELAIGNSVIVVADESPEHGYPGPQTLGGAAVNIQLFVADADALYQQAIAAGAKVFAPMQDQFYGDRSGQVTDPFGCVWTIATHKEDVSVEEMHHRLRQMESKEQGASPVPEGHHTITPYIVVPDAAALIDFVKQAFGAEEKFRAIGSAGGIHCEVRVGDSMLMIGGGGPGLSWQGKALPTSLHFYVGDAEAVYRRALEVGATSVEEPVDQPYGDREAGVKDIGGNYWWIATHKEGGHIPRGLRSVTPYLHPRRAEPVISFLKQAFGAEELDRHASPDGVIHHATVRIGDSAVEMGEAHGEWQPLPCMFYLHVPDVDASYRRAIQAGAKSLSAPADQPYGARVAGVEDVFGYQWYLATPLKMRVPE